jgi:hypothetical protein
MHDGDPFGKSPSISHPTSSTLSQILGYMQHAENRTPGTGGAVKRPWSIPHNKRPRRGCSILDNVLVCVMAF